MRGVPTKGFSRVRASAITRNVTDFEPAGISVLNPWNRI